MLNTYKAIMKDNCLEWSGEAPKNIPQDRGVAVQVTILDEVPHSAEGIMPGEEMAAALEQLAATNALSEISDPVQWERSIRQDRSLPGRD